jgi:hypothetical protein
VAYLAKDGTIKRLDGSTGTSTVLYKPDSAHHVDNLAVGPADEIIFVLASTGVDNKTQWNLHRIFPETGLTTPLTTDGISLWPIW